MCWVAGRVWSKLVHTICFYLTLGLSGGLLLLFALFNRERRTLHDFIAGLVRCANCWFE